MAWHSKPSSKRGGKKLLASFWKMIEIDFLPPLSPDGLRIAIVRSQPMVCSLGITHLYPRKHWFIMSLLLELEYSCLLEKGLLRMPKWLWFDQWGRMVNHQGHIRHRAYKAKLKDALDSHQETRVVLGSSHFLVEELPWWKGPLGWSKCIRD